MKKIIRFITAYTTIIYNFDGENIIVNPVNPKRNVERQVCTYEEAVERIKNRDDYKNVLRFEILEQVEDDSPKGVKWIIIEDLLE